LLRICGVCWNNIEPDGTCLTCRLAKRVEELEATIIELLFKIQELESVLCEYKKILVERVEELEANIKGFGVSEV